MSSPHAGLGEVGQLKNPRMRSARRCSNMLCSKLSQERSACRHCAVWVGSCKGEHCRHVNPGGCHAGTASLGKGAEQTMFGNCNHYALNAGLPVLKDPNRNRPLPMDVPLLTSNNFEQVHCVRAYGLLSTILHEVQNHFSVVAEKHSSSWAKSNMQFSVSVAQVNYLA